MNAKSRFAVFALVGTTISLFGGILACNLPSTLPTAAPTTPSTTAAGESTAAPTLPPTASLTPTISNTSTLTSTMTPVAEEIDDVPAPVIVQQAEGTGVLAIAALTSVQLEAGRQYALQVTSRAGSVNFYGTYSGATIFAEGAPGMSVELLDAATPVTYLISRPVATTGTWAFSVSVQNKGEGGIIVSILDITEE